MADEVLFNRLVFLQCTIFCFFPLVCITLITTASIFKTTIDYYAEFTNVNLNVVAALIISAGSIGFFMLLTRCCFEKLIYVEVMCYGIFPIVLILQIIAAGYGCVQSADKSHFLQKAVERDMEHIFSNYYKDKDVEARFNTLQNELECCGVYSYKDYKNKNLPKSCCPTDYIGEFCVDDTQRFNSGCASQVFQQITYHVGLLSYIAFGLIGLQVLCALVIGGIILKYFRYRIQRTYLSIDG